ncbi:hypothetical protein M378DRAFT_10373 [Amanita muscaria Koide BX008]|uniref:tRNA-dihydrouridine(47) synthase [NAD(P)(+)] n=1 Tax=Amanita muscaria (strain Koide BX008) TaxID=946122 RepID=A0A0C2X9U7_AMAMK|nr:hypothetical protein M378DRAFT_10373 [Amanita muscaria Koide BX008]
MSTSKMENMVTPKSTLSASIFSLRELHDRTPQQRYTRLADLDYIKECVEAVRAAEKDRDLPPVPIFGGGDCFSSEDYCTRVESTGVDGDGVLLSSLGYSQRSKNIENGTSVLAKGWILYARFVTNLPISGGLIDHLPQYAEYGLNHFGSDTAGVNTTRRYRCGALSFQYRYVPIGLLERLPAPINERAPPWSQ